MNPLRRPASPSARRGPASTPAALGSQAEPAPGHEDYVAFVRRMLPQQDQGVASHRIGNERVWLKKAGPRHSRLRYQLLALISRTLRLDMLTPVPNLGGETAIATEARRLRALAESGLRVPRVLAQTADGLLISDLGRDGRPATVFNERLEQAAASGPVALLAAWREGLEAIAAVHARGAYLSQAFARNLMHCPDGVIGFIDFEDDPGEALSIAECQARDWLSYLHSTALPLRASKPEGAGEAWRATLAQADPAVRERIALAARRVRWLRNLPAHRRWGRDTQRVRAVARLLGQWYPD
ncbi:hypothetical protein PGB34_20255 [Xenophilus arseniciresistens]|uniref:Serine/threonine protein phosphatase n=1 Tax=Xenophilus arseniciresistens TaxID=1283306 RepID=A0AAE3T0Y7_9BURK|nr:hypothetical protein [Xenophilus arseniciresistens]MDA7418712.1 hypothetical protein [Xenophilus arseniciresistens]